MCSIVFRQRTIAENFNRTSIEGDNHLLSGNGIEEEMPFHPSDIAFAWS